MTEETRIIHGKIPMDGSGNIIMSAEDVRSWEEVISKSLPEAKPGKFIELTKIIDSFGGRIEESKVTINTENITDVFPWPAKAEKKGTTHIAFISGDICRVKESYEFVSRLLMTNTFSVG